MLQSIISLSEGSFMFKITFETPSLVNKTTYGYTRANSQEEAVEKYLHYIKDYGYKEIKIVSATLEN